MTNTEIYDLIGSGMVLVIPKKATSNAYLFDYINEKLFRALRNPLRDTIVIDRATALELVKNNKPGYYLGKIEKEDYKDVETGRVYKQGWKSLGWDGENNDYYRAVQ